ncbi:MAG: HDIG domain-containing protein [Candidatus Cloacimonetes bacterium]|nr:HDIG domain-containing protein [Candidatus Cloacimonadota bacterium]
MKDRKNTLILISAILISLMQVVFNPFRSWERTLNLNQGQIAEREIVAPIEFDIYKSPARLEREQKEAEEQVKDIYTISDNITFNALRNLDIIFRHFEKPDSMSNSATLQEELKSKGYNLSQETCQYLINQQLRNKIYDYTAEKVARIFEIGIYPENYSDSKITVKRKNNVRDYNLFKLYGYEEARDKLIDGFSDNAGKAVIAEIADNVLVVNIIQAQNATSQEKQRARLQVPLTAGKVLKNETIIRKGERVREEQLQVLQSLHKALDEQKVENQNYKAILSVIGTFLSVLLVLVMFKLFIKTIDDFRQYTEKQYLLLLIMFFTVSLLTIVICNRFGISAMILPLSFFTIVVMQLFNRKLAFLYTTLQFFLVVILTQGQYLQPLLLTLSALAVLIVPNYNKINIRQLSVSIYIMIFLVLFTIGFGLNQLLSFGIIMQRILYGGISVFISTILALSLIPYLEVRFEIVTRQQLLELLNLENPLLKRLSKEIPGTYHHCLVVGNLAESAAEAIGANHLLARVGSYFHDIGKLSNTKVFIENNPAAARIHDDLLPNQSAYAIKKHISAGIELAKNAGLPKQVIAIISQHHGTSVIKYFRNKAIESNLEFEDHEFRYDGPLPQTREAAIIMIADIVESHSKAMNEINPEIIDNLLHETVNKLIHEGQLAEAPLTLKELNKIIKAMHPILTGVYSTRIEYPEDHDRN